MQAPYRRIFRWVAYLMLGTGLLSFVLGVVAIGFATFGPADQRSNAFADVVLGLGSGFANGAIGGGLLMGTRPDRGR